MVHVITPDYKMYIGKVYSSVSCGSKIIAKHYSKWVSELLMHDIH